jgi:hypothetical protein
MSFTGEEFAQALASSTLPIVLTGMAKKGEDPHVILFAPGASCAHWIPVPAKMIEKVDWLGKAPCQEHTHECVRLTLKRSTSPEAIVLASLLAGLSERGSHFQHGMVALPVEGQAGQAAGKHAWHGGMGGQTQHGRPHGSIGSASPPVVLASLSLAEGHSLQFVEFKPGWTGTVEVGRNRVHVPAVGPEVRSLGCLDCYRHVAGVSSAVPQTILDAHGRPQVRMAQSTIAPLDAGASGSGDGGAGAGIQVRDASEQAWFRETFCNGSQFCAQGWDWAVGSTDHKVNQGTGIAMVGSEGTVNATMTGYYWYCACTTPFCIGGPTCYWIQHWQGIVLPGHWVSLHTTTDNSFLKWDLTGAGGGTQVSLAGQY